MLLIRRFGGVIERNLKVNPHFRDGPSFPPRQFKQRPSSSHTSLQCLAASQGRHSLPPTKSQNDATEVYGPFQQDGGKLAKAYARIRVNTPGRQPLVASSHGDARHDLHSILPFEPFYDDQETYILSRNGAEFFYEKSPRIAPQLPPSIPGNRQELVGESQVFL